MGTKILGPVSSHPDVEAEELSQLFANPRKAFRKQNTFNSFPEFMACAIARAKALDSLGAKVNNIPESAESVPQVNRWVVFDNGYAMPALGGTYSQESVWPANPEHPLHVVELARSECGQKHGWRASWGSTLEEAMRNVTSHFSDKLCATIREGNNPNNALRAAST